MEVIKGKKAYIEFLKGENFLKFGCAQSWSFEETVKIKPVKTKGDGYKERYRGQSVSAILNLSGLTMFNDVDFTDPFDLVGHCDQMVDIDFRIYFDDASGTHVNGIFGTALVTLANIGSDVAFSRGSFTLQVNEWTHGLPPVCVREIRTMTITRQGLTFLYAIKIMTLDSGSVPMYDWRIDGGDIRSSLSTGWTINVADESNFIHGSHVLEIWPVCDNGARGVKTTRNFTIPI